MSRVHHNPAESDFEAWRAGKIEALVRAALYFMEEDPARSLELISQAQAALQYLDAMRPDPERLLGKAGGELYVASRDLKLRNEHAAGVSLMYAIRNLQTFQSEWVTQRPVRKNSDSEVRRLERLAATGDPEAVQRLAQWTARRTGDPLLARGLELQRTGGQNVVTKPAGMANRRLREGKITLLDAEVRGRKSTVKNLGWLLRQLRQHNSTVFVRTLPGGACYFKVVLAHFVSSSPGNFPVGPTTWEWESTFETVFNDCDVLWGWLHRPLLWGSPLDYDGKRGVIPEVYGGSSARRPALGEPWLPLELHGPKLEERVDYEHFPKAIEPRVRRWVEGGQYYDPVANPRS